MTPCASDDLFKLAVWFYRRWKRRAGWVDLDDLWQTVWVALLEARRKYDPGRATNGYGLLAFARPRVRGRVLTFVRRERFRGMNAKGVNIPADGVAGFERLDETMPAREPPADEPTRWDRISAGLSDRERQILWLRYAEGLSQVEAGRRMGISRKPARYIEARALRKLQGSSLG